ncbi:MAG: molybdopterin synthase catalytic subunit MoaE [Rhodobacteraceae bacterium HLUCCA08]|nr:MAG: molybdopterin synthase catalytic subunit MoaE [Rhodobacteraceae bacterium HLUCCA08]
MIRVQQDPFDPGAELNAFSAAVAGAGAVVSFSGLVRDVAGGLRAMEIEHYPGMTEKALAEIRDQAVARWALAEALVIHRHGRLEPGEVIMMVATAARHRADAFAAAEFLMDYLKSRAPFWKKEETGDGSDWVAARDADEDALKRW